MHDHLDKQVVQRNDALSSPLRALFQTLKNLSCQQCTFVTGISPLALADASAANNFNSIYGDSHLFADLLGFRSDALDSVLRTLRFDDGTVLHDGEVEHVLGVMRWFYNGYHFRGAKATLFNPTSSVYFLDKLTEDMDFRRRILDHQPEDDVLIAENMSDSNVRGSRNVLQLVAAAAGGHGAVRKYSALLNQDGALHDACLTVRKAAMAPFRLDDVMRQLDAPPASSSTDVPLALLFFNGPLTCRQQPTAGPAAEPDKVQLVLPNELPRLLHTKDVQTAVEASVDYLHRLVESPRADTVQRLLQRLFDSTALGPPATFDQHWRESTMAGIITTSLRTFTQKTSRHVGVEVLSEQAAGRGYYDVLLQTTDSEPQALLLELGIAT